MPLHSPDRTRILAFRLDGHHLTHRLPLDSIQIAAGACGVQNTPPGSAAISLHARLRGLTPQVVDQALTGSRVLLQTWSLRASPHIFPACDHPVFTLGLLPGEEEEIRAFLFGVKPALDMIQVHADYLVQIGADVLPTILDDRAMVKDELGIALADTVAPHLNPRQREAWKSASLYASGQSLGESVMRFILPVLALLGLCCHAERRGNQAFIRRTDRWLSNTGSPPTPDALDRHQARAELVRRYLHCYGPSTPQAFAAWAGISVSQAQQAWETLQDELVEIQAPGAWPGPPSGTGDRPVGWLHQADLPRYQSPPQPAGIRFLPPHDPYLQMRDREMLVPDRSLRQRIWRTSGSPGVVIAGGEAVACWYARKQGKRLAITIEFLPPYSPSISPDLEAEAAALAQFKGHAAVEIRI